MFWNRHKSGSSDVDESDKTKTGLGRDDASRQDVSEKRVRPKRRAGLAWPLGLAVAGFGSAAAAILLSGCRHSKMSWPMKTEHGDFSYQVCTNCGIKRLYDEEAFRPYGPFGYDLHSLIATERLRNQQRIERSRRDSSPKTA